MVRQYPRNVGCVRVDIALVVLNGAYRVGGPRKESAESLRDLLLFDAIVRAVCASDFGAGFVLRTISAYVETF